MIAPKTDTAQPNHMVLDLKTASSITAQWVSGQRVNPAYPGYVVGAQMSGIPNVMGAIVAAMQTSKLPASERCRTHKLPRTECLPLHVKSDIVVIEYTQYKLDQWLAEAKHWARRVRETMARFPELDQIHQVRQQGRRLGKCSEYGGCTYQEYCLGDRQAKLLELFAVRPYNPYGPEEEDGILRLSNSSISAFAGCSTRGVMRYLHHLDRIVEHPAPTAGTACHKAWELHMNGEPVDACLLAFDNIYLPFSQEQQLDPEDRLSFDNIRTVLEIFLHRHPLHDLPFKPVTGMQEIAFEFPLLPAKGNLPPVHYCGRIDGVVEF